MSNEFELIKHNKVSDLYAFVIEMKYRRPHLHTDIEIIYVLEGRLTVISDNKQIIVEKNQLTVLNSCQLHELFSEDSAQLLIFQLGLKQFEQSFPQIYELYFDSVPMAISSDKEKQRLLAHIIEASQAYYHEETYFSLLCHGFASLILFDLIHLYPYQKMSETSKNRFLIKNERIRRISDYIQQNYEKKLLLSDIAESENLTVPYLSHFFRDNFGLSFQDYLNMIRCEKAMYLLSHTHHHLLGISELCGFSDVRYLNRAFTNLYGLTPKEFRKAKNTAPLLQYQLDSQKGIDQQLIYNKEESLNIINQYFSS